MTSVGGVTSGGLLAGLLSGGFVSGGVMSTGGSGGTMIGTRSGGLVTGGVTVGTGSSLIGCVTAGGTIGSGGATNVAGGSGDGATIGVCGAATVWSSWCAGGGGGGSGAKLTKLSGRGIDEAKWSLESGRPMAPLSRAAARRLASTRLAKSCSGVGPHSAVTPMPRGSECRGSASDGALAITTPCAAAAETPWPGCAPAPPAEELVPFGPAPPETISAAITAAAATSGLAATAARLNALTRLALVTLRGGLGSFGAGTSQASSGRPGRATSSSASSAGPGTSSLSASSPSPRARRRGTSETSMLSRAATFSSGIARRSERSSSARVPGSSS